MNYFSLLWEGKERSGLTLLPFWRGIEVCETAKRGLNNISEDSARTR